MNKLNMSEEEFCAFAYGFDDAYMDTSDDSRQSVDGKFNRLPNSFDGDTTEFDNFLTKKGRERGKERKELRESGLSRKDARKEALSKIPKDKLKEVANNVAKGVGKAILKGGLIAPRGAYLSLLALNFRGQAYKVMAVVNGTNEKLKKQLKSKWEGLGGKYDSLVKTATKGATKKPFFCGKECNEKLLTSDITAESIKSTPIDAEYLNLGGVDDAVIVAWIGLGSTMIGVIGSVVGKAQDTKLQKAEIESAEKLAEQENATLTKIEKDKIDLKKQELATAGDPTAIVLNNPNLTQEEKATALKQIEIVETKATESNAKKYLMYGGIALLGFFLFRSFSKSK
jgi:hypothetical protein